MAFAHGSLGTLHLARPQPRDSLAYSSCCIQKTCRIQGAFPPESGWEAPERASSFRVTWVWRAPSLDLET